MLIGYRYRTPIIKSAWTCLTHVPGLRFTGSAALAFPSRLGHSRNQAHHEMSTNLRGLRQIPEQSNFTAPIWPTAQLDKLTPTRVNHLLRRLCQSASDVTVDQLLNFPSRLREAGQPLGPVAYQLLARLLQSRCQDVDWIDMYVKNLEADQQITHDLLEWLMETAMNASVSNVQIMELLLEQSRNIAAQSAQTLEVRPYVLMSIVYLQAGKPDSANKVLQQSQVDAIRYRPYEAYETVIQAMIGKQDFANASSVLPGYIAAVERNYRSKFDRQSAYETAILISIAIKDVTRLQDYVSQKRKNGGRKLWWTSGFQMSIVELLAKGIRQNMSIVETVIELGCLTDVKAFNRLLHDMERKGMTDELEKISTAFLQAGRKLDVTSFTHLISTYARTGDLPRAKLLFRSMTSDLRMKPDATLCTLMIKIHRGAGDLEGARNSFSQMKGFGIVPDTMTYTTMMDTYVELAPATAGDHCDDLLSQMGHQNIPPNVHTYQALIRSRRDHPLLAHKHFRDMEARGLVPDVHNYVALMDAYATAGGVDNTVSVFEKLLASTAQHKPNRVVFNILLKAAYVARDMDAMHCIFEGMKAANVWPDSRTWFMMIDASCKLSPTMEDAEQIFNTACKDAATGNFVLQIHEFHAMMNGYARRGQVTQCLAVRDKMRASIPGSDTATRTLNIVMHAFSRAKNFPAVQKLWNSMLNTRNIDQASIAQALDSAGHDGSTADVHRIISQCETHQIELNENAYNSYIEALGRKEEYAHAVMALFDMVANGVDPSPKTYRTLIVPLKSAGKRALEKKVREFMQRHYPAVVSAVDPF
ncbi:hypothetical protein DFJ77DRAFT_452349 [Powellomyces hirtus]|nr:hypothetical protein DFJ77DRAFT_452349 [Powellomyces hirtus]